MAKEALARLVKLGIPNFFGEQRFGVGGDNAEKGKRILQSGGRHRDRFERKLFLSRTRAISSIACWRSG